MRAVLLERPGAVAVETVDDPECGPDGLVVRVEACGVCGTDLHIADGEFPPTPYPITPGHEFAGVVEEVGPAAPGGWRPGDRVAVDPSLFCGRCAPCHRGHGNLCEDWNAIGDTVAGAFAELVRVPAANAYRLDDDVDFRRGALIEPLSCAVHGMDRLGPVLGASVLLTGAGTMGLLLLQLLRRAGASSVTVVDRATDRLAVAAGLGADATAGSVGDLGGERYDVVVDATGSPGAIEAAFAAVARGGRFMVFGVSPAEATVRLSPFRIYNDELTIVGSMAVLDSYQTAVELMGAGVVDAGPLLTHAMPLSRFPEALDMVRNGVGIKVQVLPQEG